jgi:hypothetical protein
MPVRKVSHGGRNIIGQFPSIKMGRMIAFESLIERDCLYFLDFEADISYIAEQPLTLEYKRQGKVLRYTPDFHIILSNKNVLIECKPAAFVDTENNLLKFAAAREWCKSNDWEFKIVSDNDLRSGYRLQNVKHLTRCARQPAPPQLISSIWYYLESTSVPLPILALAQTIAPNNPTIVITAVLYLTYHRQLHIALDTAPISVNSLVSLMSQPRKRENQ